jgi:glucose dehydrogenase
MRVAGLLLLPGLALLLLAAHLLHAGWLPLAGLALLLIALLFVRRPWAARAVQVVLAIATIEWALTAYGLAQLRLDHGQPYLRLVLILGSVTLFTALAAAAFQHPALRTRFGLPGLGERAT